MVKRYIYKKIINIKYKKSLKYKERKSIKESQKDIHDFYYQHTPRFKQDIEINPEYDLMIMVPVYNAAEYLEDCIKSLLVQETGYSYCVVFVNDGSTDESANILNKYAKKENVYIINKKNEGVAEARNIALKYIRGKCVLFVDADDMLMDNAIEVLMRKSVETDADIVEGEYIEFDNNIKPDIHKDLICKTKSTRLNGYPWGKIIKAEKWVDLCFPKGYLYEDTIISTLLIPGSRKIIKIPNIVYYYRNNPKGISANTVKKKEVMDTLYITQSCFEEAVKRGYKPSIDDFIEQVRLNWIRTQNVPLEIKKAIFIIEKEMINNYFNGQATKLGRKWEKLLLSLEKSSFVSYELLMNKWYLFN